MGEKKITKEKFTNLVNKATEFGKKAVADIQQSQKEQKEKRLVEKREKDIKKFKPLFEADYTDPKFNIPNVIHIVDDADRREIEVCEGAIGWLERQNDVEVLKLYDEWMNKIGITFVPVAKCDSIYCIDPYDKSRFIDVEDAFDRTTREKISELERVAYSLGAKRCRIEIMEDKSMSDSTKVTAGVEVKALVDLGNKKSDSVTAGTSIENENSTSQRNQRSGKNWTYFEGNNVPSIPELKWFKYDDNIKGLIDMRCSGNNGIKHKVIEFKCSQSATMSAKTATAVNGLMGGAKIGIKSSFQKKHTQELTNTLIYEIEF